jgi:hypothetical protein
MSNGRKYRPGYSTAGGHPSPSAGTRIARFRRGGTCRLIDDSSRRRPNVSPDAGGEPFLDLHRGRTLRRSALEPVTPRRGNVEVFDLEASVIEPVGGTLDRHAQSLLSSRRAIRG